MGISDKEAFRILGLPLGVDKDAINERYKKMSSKLSASKSPDDKKKLEQVVAAYSQLLPPSLNKIQQNKQNNRSSHAKSHATGCEDDDDSDDASSEDECRVLCRNGDARNHLTKTNLDLTDAEKEKRKAEKRRAKKKRRKEKKKLEKLENQIFNQNPNNSNSKRNDDSGSDDEEEDDDDDDEDEVQGLDPNSAFVATAAGKKIGLGATSKHEDRRKTLSKVGSQEDDDVNTTTNVDALVLQSHQKAIRGNEAANVGQYSVAVRLFTDAIHLNPSDHRFFGNRSYCYDQLKQYEKALKDAERAVKIAPEWPKGHYRKGTSLRGLGKYIDAESAFEEVLRLDKGCREAQEEIRKVRIIRIVEMGFTDRQAKSAIAKYKYVQPALDALLAGEFKESLEDVFESDDEDDFLNYMKIPQGSKDVKMKTHTAYDDTHLTRHHHVSPRNPEGLTSLWVGNVLPEVTEKMLSQLFSKQGHVTSVRLLKEKYCAFVNYADKAAAGRAMEVLQGYELCGQKLLIKFPDNPIVNSAQNVVMRKNKSQSIKNNTKVSSVPGAAVISATPLQVQVQLQSSGSKLKGPVNGDECYFWRTTGCAFGDACKHKHIPRNKGIDRKPWQK